MGEKRKFITDTESLPIKFGTFTPAKKGRVEAANKELERVHFQDCLRHPAVRELREALQQYIRNHPIPEGFNRICKALEAMGEK